MPVVLVGQVFTSAGVYIKTLGSPRNLEMCNQTPASGGETLFSLSVGPSVAQRSKYDASIVRRELGVQFTVRTAGMLAAVRYVKPSGDVQRHTARVYDANFNVLYAETFDMDSCAWGDWVNLTFNKAVAVTAGSTYAVTIDQLDSFAATDAGFASASTGGNLWVDPDYAGCAYNFTWTQSATNFWVDGETDRQAPIACCCCPTPLAMHGHAVAACYPTPLAAAMG